MVFRKVNCMKLSEILKKQEEIKLRAIKIHIETNKSVFGTINAKKFMKFIERLYQKNDKRIL